MVFRLTLSTGHSIIYGFIYREVMNKSFKSKNKPVHWLVTAGKQHEKKCRKIIGDVYNKGYQEWLNDNNLKGD